MSKVFKDIPRVNLIIDDILVWGENKKQHNIRMLKVLKQARSHSLKLNKNKCHVNQNEFSYVCWSHIKQGWIEAGPKQTEAITVMPHFIGLHIATDYSVTSVGLACLFTAYTYILALL